MSLPKVNPNKPFLSGWSRRKMFTLNSTFSSREVILNVTVFNTSGTDTDTTVYLGGNVRSDWGDLRITKQDGLTAVPFAILRRAATSIEIAIKMIGKVGDNFYYLYYDGPAADLFKIGRTTDQHYDPNGGSGGASEFDRVNTLTKLAAFNTRMGIWEPDLILHGGDHTGAQSSVEATQLSWMEDVFDETQNGPVGVPVAIVSPGNHDFEYISNANFRALLDNYQTWMEASVNYGKAFESTDYIILSLDSNDTTSGHESISHKGSGYLGSAQLTWLQDQLEAATKPVIIDIHHPCGEMDTDQFTLTKDLYHTENRKTFRDIVEQSGKVIAVLHGHMHVTRADAIKGIPYIVCTNLTDDESFSEVPLSTDGKWTEIEFDKSSRTINVKHIALISAEYETVYEMFLPFGITTFSADISNNPEQGFKLSFGSTFGKSSILRDPTQLYVVNDDYMYKFPVNLYTPDNSPLFKEAIKIVGRTDTPNFGRALWWYENLSNKLIFEGWIMMGSQKFFAVKLGGANTTGLPAVYVNFRADGNCYLVVNTTPVDELLFAYSLNQWYKFEFFIDPVSGGYSLAVDGVAFDSYGFYGGPKLVFREMEIVTEAGDFWISGFSIRKWRSPRPTLEGFETEETV